MAPPRKYPAEVREQALRLYFEASPRPVIRRLAEQLGVHHEALRTWVRQAQGEREKGASESTAAQWEELRQLRQENAELRRTNDILKAASVFFAQEMDTARRR